MIHAERLVIDPRPIMRPQVFRRSDDVRFNRPRLTAGAVVSAAGLGLLAALVLKYVAVKQRLAAQSAAPAETWQPQPTELAPNGVK